MRQSHRTMFPSYNAGATLFTRLSRASRHEQRPPASSLECQHGKDGSKNMVTKFTNAPTSSARFRAGCPRWNLLRLTAARARRNAGGDNRSPTAGPRSSGFTEPMMARGGTRFGRPDLHLAIPRANPTAKDRIVYLSVSVFTAYA